MAREFSLKYVEIKESILKERSQSKEINREYTLEGLMLKRKLRYFGHLI